MLMWIESDIKLYLSSVLSRQTARDFRYGVSDGHLAILTISALLLHLHTIMQFQSTRQRLSYRGHAIYLASSMCRFGCLEIHRTFVYFTRYSSDRTTRLRIPKG